MSMKWSELTASQEFTALPDDQKEKVRTGFFEKNVAPTVKDPGLLPRARAEWDRATLPKPATKQTSLIPEQSKPEGVTGAFKSGVKSTVNRLGSTVDAYQGDTAGVEQGAKDAQGIQKTKEQEAFSESVRLKSEEADDSVWDGIRNVTTAAWDNPTGALHEVAAQLPNSAPALAGMWAGAKLGGALGTAVPGVGTGVGAVSGALIGMFVGNTAIETGGIAQEKAEDGTVTQGELADARQQGATKAGVITGVDAVTMKMGSLIMGAPGRAVEKALTAKLVEKGIDVSNPAAVKAVLGNKALLKEIAPDAEAAFNAAMSMKRRVGRGAAGMGLESIGEGVGEYAGSSAAGLDASFTEAALESLLSIPQSAIELNVSKKLNTPGQNTILTARNLAAHVGEEEAGVLQNADIPKAERVKAAKLVADKMKAENPALSQAFINHALQRIGQGRAMMEDGEASLYESLRPADRHRIDQELLALPAPKDMGHAPIPVAPKNNSQIDGASTFFGSGFDSPAAYSPRAEDMTLPNLTGLVRSSTERLRAAQETGDTEGVKRHKFELESALRAQDSIKAGNADRAMKELETKRQEFAKQFMQKAIDETPTNALPAPDHKDFSTRMQGLLSAIESSKTRNVARDEQAINEIGSALENLKKINIAKPMDPARDDLLTMIAKAGGLSRTEMAQQGIDPAAFGERRGIGYVFKENGGHSLDAMAENLSQYGFFPDGQYTANGLLDMVGNALRGEGVYAPAASEHRANIESLINNEETLRRRIEKTQAVIGQMSDDDIYYAGEMYELIRQGATADEIEAAINAMDLTEDGDFFSNMAIIREAKNVQGAQQANTAQQGQAESNLARDQQGLAAGQAAAAEQAGEVDGTQEIDASAEISQPSALRGNAIDKDWTAFAPESGTLNVPRETMPQVKAEHRGALANFLKARGITGEDKTVPATTLKPTQAEFSEAKVQKAKDFAGGDRAILVSSDGHVLDGHHQWMSKHDNGEDVRVIQLDAPIKMLLEEIKEFPSVEQSQDSAPNLTQESPNVSQEAGTLQTEADESPGASIKTQSRTETSQNQAVASIGSVSGQDGSTTSEFSPATGAANDQPAPQTDNADIRQADGANASVQKQGKGADEAGSVRAPLNPGDRFRTTSGRVTGPFPKNYKNAARDMKELREWLKKEAIAEALSRNDKFNLRQWEQLDPKNWSPADGDAVNLYLFDDETGSIAGRKVSDAEIASVADKPSLELTQESEAEREAREKAEKKARDVAAKAKREQEAKAKAEDDGKNFNLSGSDRPTDIKMGDDAASGQSDLVDSQPAETDRKKSYGKKNKVFSEDQYQKDLQKLRGQFGTLNSGLDPELMAAGLRMAGYHIEAGARHFSDYMKAMVADLGAGVKPYLRGWYENVRYYPGFDNAGMTTADEIESILSQEEQDNVSSPSVDLESNSENAGAQEPVGDVGVRNEPGETGSLSESASQSPGQKVRGQGGAGVSAGSASAAGTTSNNQLHRPDGTIKPESEPAGNTDAGGRVGSGEQRVQVKQAGSGNAVKAVDRATKRGGELKSSANKQASADAVNIIDGDLENIRETLPVLLPEQQEDVHFAEKRLIESKGRGVLFTNGTGTGKTFTGLGTIKRYVRRGKDSVLIVVPNDKIAADWVSSGKMLNLDIARVADTKDNGKTGPVVTTYANFYQNMSLVDRDWDLITFDESHYLLQRDDLSDTVYGNMMRALSGHERGRSDYHKFKRHELFSERDKIRKQISANNSIINLDDTMDQQRDSLIRENTKLGSREAAIDEKLRIFKEEDVANRKARWDDNKTDIVFLSATPFAYRKSIDYAEGFLFDYGPESDSQAYNSGSNRDQFFVSNFGYRMRYNKLTEPDAQVDVAMMEREFSDRLRQSGAVKSRLLEVEKDYDRRFYLVADAIGEKIDEGMDLIRERGRSSDGMSKEEKALADGYSALAEMINQNFDYLNRAYLLEAIKAKHMIPVIKKHLAMGRQVVLFHDYNKGGGFHPFAYDWLLQDVPAGESENESAVNIRNAYRDFISGNPEFRNLDFTDLLSPVMQMEKSIPGALFFNGRIPKSERRANVERFNDDAHDARLIVVQSDAGREGVSLHDTTGSHQRVLINIGLPVKPIASIQTEGRIYRTFVQTDAIQRYVSTGLNMERWAVASKLAARSATAENLSMGSMARGLKDAFVEAYESAESWEPGHSGEGQGGKELDRALFVPLTDFQRAKTYYWGQRKRTEKRDQREGKDYFATPEPVGVKMVEMANIKPGEKVLEPSAGHGAILRWMKDLNDVHYIEPSGTLASKAAMSTPHANYHDGVFEDMHLVNKFDAIVMNPPYGSGGKTAADHVGKAIKHLRDGGRVVALIPTGPAADKQFDKLMESEIAKDVYTVANIAMPSSTFDRAGTSVSTRILVLEKQTDKDSVAQIRQTNRDYSGAANVNELFDRIESLEIPERIPVKVEGAPAPATTADVETWEAEHSKTGDSLFMAKPTKKLDRDAYQQVASVAKKHGGYWSRFGKAGFLFKSEEDRSAFTAAIGPQSTTMLRDTANTGPAGPVSFADAEKSVSGITLDWSSVTEKRVKVVAAFADLPAQVQTDTRKAGGSERIRGVFHDGSIYLIAGNHSSVADVERTVFHDAYVHLGFDGLFGKQVRAKMGELYIAIGGSKGLNTLAQKHGINLTRYAKRLSELQRNGEMNANTRNSVMMEELLAHMAEDNRPSVKRKAREVIGAILNWLRSKGFPGLGNLKDAELFLLLKRSREAIVTNNRGKGFYIRAGEPMFRTEPTKSAYEDRIDALFSGARLNRQGVKVLDRSDILDLLGHGDKPLRLVESAVGKVRDDGIVAHPGMTAEQWKRVPHWIDNPAAAFKSDSVAGRITLIAPELVDGKPVLIVLKPNGSAGGLDAHVLVNAYEKDRPGDVPIQRWVREQKLLYLDQKRSPEISERSGLRLPRDVRQLRGYKQRVFTERDLVKYRASEDQSMLRDDGHPFTLSGTNPSDNSRTGLQAQSILARNWTGNAEESIAAAIREAKAIANRDVVDWLQVNEGRVGQDSGRAMFREESTADDVMAEKLGLGKAQSQSLAGKIRDLKSRNWKQAMDAIGNRAFEGAFDGLVGIKLAEDAVGRGVKAGDYANSGYVGARLSTGLADTMHAVLHYGAPMWRGGVLEYKPGTRGLLEVFADLGDDLNPWLGWMAGNRGAELMAQGRENNLTEDDVRTLQGLAKGKEAKFQKAKDEYAAMNKAMLDMAEEAGLIDADSRGDWESEWYVPFYRHSEADGNLALLAPRTKRGLSHQSAGIKMLKGGEAATNDLLENIIANWMKMTDASMKNMALLKAVDNLRDTEYLTDESVRWQQVVVSKSEIAKRIKTDRKTMAAVAEFLGMGDGATLEDVANELAKVDSEGFERLWGPVAPKDPDIIRVQRNNKSEYYRVNDPALLRAVTHLQSSGFNDPVTRAGRWFKRLLTTGVTASPDFILRNFIRDAAHAWAINPDGFTFGKDSIKGLAGALKEDPAYRELMFAGASFQGGYVHGTDPEATAQIIRRALEKKGLTRGEVDAHMGTLLNTAGKLKSAVESGWQKYRTLGDKVENANRLATFRASRAKGKSLAQSVFEAKDLMDYSLRGNYQALVWLTDVVPFLNARLQGLSKLGRAGKADPRAVGIAIGKIALFSVFLAALNDDDEKYQELQDWDKDAYWHFWIGDDHWRIPKPFEIGIIAGTIPERIYHGWLTDNQPPEKVRQALVHAMAGTLSFNPLPQAIIPAVEAWGNRSFFFDTPIEGMADKGKRPEDRYNTYTSDSMVALGQTFGASPKVLQHLWEGYTGTMGAYALAATDMLVRGVQDGKAPRPAWSVSDLPVAKSFYRGSSPARSTQYVTDLYDRLEEVNQIHRSIKDYAATDEGKARELLNENLDKLTYRKALTGASKRLADLRKAQKRISNDQTMTPEAKRKMLDGINAQINKVAAGASKVSEGAF